MGAIDGVKPKHRLNQWARERLAQTMACIEAFNTLPTDADQYLCDNELLFIRRVLEAALTEASRQTNVINSGQGPITWAIWLAQDRHAVRRGAWEVNTIQSQLSLSFMGMRTFLEHAFSHRGMHFMSTTLDERRRDAHNLSDLLVACGISPLHPEIMAQFAPKLVSS